MNKNMLFGLFAAFIMLLVTSCSNDELNSVQSGDEAQVTFSLGLEGGIGSRAAISDGTKIDKLVYAVYKLDANNTPVLQKVSGSDNNSQFVTIDAFENLTQQVTVTLAKGQTYQVAFWAQNSSCGAYDTDDLTDVTISYDGRNNDEDRDAFFKMVEFEVEGNKTIEVELKRPFAQINVGVDYTEDWYKAVASGISINESSVTLKNAANRINLLTGAVNGSTNVTYTLNSIPGEDLWVDIDGDKVKDKAYKWLSMSYILVADNSTTKTDDGVLGAQKTTLNSLAFTFSPESGNDIVFSEGLNNVPVQRNWRTNILGKILTGDIQFNVTIDPSYLNDYNYPQTPEQELEFLATFGGKCDLSSDITSNVGVVVGKDMVLDLKGNMLNGTLTVNDDVILTIKDSAPSVEKVSELTIKGKPENIKNEGGVILIKIADNEYKVYPAGYFPQDIKADDIAFVYSWDDFTTKLGEDKKYLVLGNKIEYDKSYSLLKDVTIDLNGMTFEITVPTEKFNIGNKNNASAYKPTVTIKNGYLNCKVYAQTGNVTLSKINFGGTIAYTDDAQGVISVGSAADLLAEGCDMKNVKANAAGTRPRALSSEGRSGGNLRLIDCNFPSSSDGTGTFVATKLLRTYITPLSGSAKLEITNCKFGVAANIDLGASYVWTNMNLTGCSGGFTFTVSRAKDSLTEEETAIMKDIKKENSGTIKAYYNGTLVTY